VVNNMISTILDGLVASVSRIWVLLVGLTLPVVNTEEAKNVCNVVTGAGQIKDTTKKDKTKKDQTRQRQDKPEFFLSCLVLLV
jgi:hypothetical protein